MTSILTKHGICPKLINDVGKIILLEITQLKIRFVTTEMYHFDQALQTEIMKKYAIRDHFFPYSFNKPENYSYIGQIPTLNKFIDLSDSESIVQKKDFFSSITIKLKIGLLSKSLMKILIINVFCCPYIVPILLEIEQQSPLHLWYDGYICQVRRAHWCRRTCGIDLVVVHSVC